MNWSIVWTWDSKWTVNSMGNHGAGVLVVLVFDLETHCKRQKELPQLNDNLWQNTGDTFPHLVCKKDKVWICNYTLQIYVSDKYSSSCPDNEALDYLSLKLGHGWVVTYHKKNKKHLYMITFPCPNHNAGLRRYHLHLLGCCDKFNRSLDSAKAHLCEFTLFKLFFHWTKWLPFPRWHFQMTFHEWKFFYLIGISLKFIPIGPTDNTSA